MLLPRATILTVKDKEENRLEKIITSYLSDSREIADVISKFNN